MTSQKEVGARNRTNVLFLLRTCPGISRVEIAARLGLSTMAVTRHVTAIRQTWGAGSLPTKRTLRQGDAAVINKEG